VYDGSVTGSATNRRRRISRLTHLPKSAVHDRENEQDCQQYYQRCARLPVPDLKTRDIPKYVGDTSVGLRLTWRTSELFGSKNFQIAGRTAFSRGDGPHGNRSGWGYIVDYPNDFLDCFTALNQFGNALNPALGFLPRPGIRKLDAACVLKPRPANKELDAEIVSDIHPVRPETA
jgi:hypothetical protein